MSERSDLINKLPHKHLTDEDLVYDLESITNNYNDIIHNMLISKVGLSSDVVNDDTDWDTLDLNSTYLVTSWQGRNAPSISGDEGTVFTIGSPSSKIQIAFGYNNDPARKIAIRVNSDSWTYINQGVTPDQMNGSIKAAFQGVNIKSVANNVSTLNTQISSASNAISSNTDSLVEAQQKSADSLSGNLLTNTESLSANASGYAGSLSAVNTNNSNKENADVGSINANLDTRVSMVSERADVESLSANTEASAESLAHNIDTKENTSSENSDVRNINDSLDAKLDITSEKADLKSAYSVIGSKEDISSHKSDVDSLSATVNGLETVASEQNDVNSLSVVDNKIQNGIKLDSTNDLNKVINNGHYWWNYRSEPENIPNENLNGINIFSGYVIVRNDNGGDIIQHCYSYSGDYFYRYKKFGNAWNNWIEVDNNALNSSVSSNASKVKELQNKVASLEKLLMVSFNQLSSTLNNTNNDNTSFITADNEADAIDMTKNNPDTLVLYPN